MPAPLDARRKRKRRSHTKEPILAAAETLFAERGFSGASLNDIARAAGVSKAVVIYHFRSKRFLYLKILDGAFERLNQMIGEHVDADGTNQGLRAWLGGYFLWARTYPLHNRLLIRAQLDNPENASRTARRYFEPLMARAEELMEKNGETMPDELSTRVFLSLIGGSVVTFFICLTLFSSLVDQSGEKNEEEIIAEFDRQLKFIIHRALGD